MILVIMEEAAEEGIYIETGALSGTGTITANGGKNSTSLLRPTTGGGGGRIAI